MDKPAKKKKDEAKPEAPAKASKADKAEKPAKTGEADVKKEKKSKDAPDFRIFSGQTEFGAAWMKTSKEDRAYLSVKLRELGWSVQVPEVRAGEPESQPRPVPLTRPEMKQLLEDLKSRKPRIPLPPLTNLDLLASNLATVVFDNPSITMSSRKWGDGHVTLMKAYDDGAERGMEFLLLGADGVHEHRQLLAAFGADGKVDLLHGAAHFQQREEVRLVKNAGAGREDRLHMAADQFAALKVEHAKKRGVD